MPLLFPSASPYPSSKVACTTSFNELSQRIRRYFVRQEPHHRALSYMQGLMSPVERKTDGKWLKRGRSYIVQL
jgi:hypothetical protein